MLDCKEYSIIMVGSAALTAAIEILENRGEELKKRYSKRYLDEAYARLLEYRRLQEAAAEALSQYLETDEEDEAGKKRDTGVRESLKETFQTFAGDETGSSSICGHDCSKERNVPYLICCGLDGVFGALYRLGDMLKTGLRARLYDIPIDQVTIELCDYMDINPYEADTKGAFLIASDSHGRMLKELKEKGIPAKLIGYTARDNSRIVLGPTERYLTK